MIQVYPSSCKLRRVEGSDAGAAGLIDAEIEITVVATAEAGLN